MYVCIHMYIYMYTLDYCCLRQESRWRDSAGATHADSYTGDWPIQDIVLLLGSCARIKTTLCAPTLRLGTPPHPVIAYTIAQYNVCPRPPVIAIYTTQYGQ